MLHGKGGRVNDLQNPQHKKSSSTDTLFDLNNLSERRTLPPPLQRIIDKADEDEAIYDDYWAGR